MERHNISWELINSAYVRQMHIHERLAQEYKKHGLVYGGRTFYTAYDKNNIIRDKRGTYIKGQYSNFIPSAGTLYGTDINVGVAGLYTKMVTDIHRKVLNEICDEIYKETNTHLLDKFNTLDISGISQEGFQKMIKASAELVYDIKKAKSWVKETERIIEKVKKNNMSANKSNKRKYLLSIRELESIGRAILGKAIELAPIETGFLRASGTVYTYSNSIRIIFECPYATYVHENVNIQHPIGQAKFLETAAQDILRNTGVWVNNTSDSFVYGTYMKQVWERDAYGIYGNPNWVEQAGYSAVYIDIDRNLNINYVHYGTK